MLPHPCDSYMHYIVFVLIYAARMEYLLAQEHLHWKNALELIGYTDGPLDELNKKHPGLVPYPDITDERNRSMGELAVKSMLALREK